MEKPLKSRPLTQLQHESNYEYEREGKKVFTTAYFREARESFLSAEQFEKRIPQPPFEAKGPANQ